MSERCPLSGGGHAIESLPSFCLKNCFDRWDRVYRDKPAIVDDFAEIEPNDSHCQHENLGVSNSHEGLATVGKSSTRVYSIVDKCDNCQTEL